MYYYFSRPKMSVNAVRSARVGARGGADRLRNGSRCAGGGDSGELVNGNGRLCALDIATPSKTEFCDTESLPAVAQPIDDWGKSTSSRTIADEVGSGKQKRKSPDCVFLSDSPGSIIARPVACGQYGYSGGFADGCAVDRQSREPGKNNGIAIDHKFESSRHGGERLYFMDCASQRSKHKDIKPLAPVTRRADREQTAGPDSMTAAARCGQQDADLANSKRRGCRLTRAPKRVCYAGTSAVDCGTVQSDMGIGDSLQNLSKCQGSQLESSKDKQTHGTRRGDSCGVEQAQSKRTSPGDFSELNSTNSLPSANDVARNVNSEEKVSCKTSKGRVRMYRVRSFLSTCPRYMNGHSEGVQCHFNGRTASLPKQDPVIADEKSVASTVSQSESDENERKPTCAASLCATKTNRSAFTKEQNSHEKLEVQVEQASKEASRRQTQLEGRSERMLRRLQAVQVKQVERHITQQLKGLTRASRGSGVRKSMVQASNFQRELGQLTHSCSKVLATSGGALDSDHTASSSAGDSDSDWEQPEQGRPAWRDGPVRRLSKPVWLAKEMQWAQERALLGSRWVWLQAQVSELEYRIRALTELYTHLRQGKGPTVPDTPLRVPRPPQAPNPAPCKSSVGGKPISGSQAEDPALPPQAPPSPSTTARTCPLPRLHRHKLLRLDAFPALGSKVASLRCSCDPSVMCVLCAGTPSHLPSHHRECIEQRSSQLDLCVHPVLSLPSDIPLVVQCGTSPLVDRHSQSALGQTGLLAPPTGLGRRGQGTQRAGRVRRRLVCPRPPTTLPPLYHSAGGTSVRNCKSVASPALLSQPMTDLPPLSSTPPTLGSINQPLRRRRGESSFDIDNLVMPMGLAGLRAPVQRLQYKEIITPSWREVIERKGVSLPHPHPPTHSDPQEEGQTEPEPEEEEDMSDETFLSRHAVCENRERGRWRSWAHRHHRGRSSSVYGGGRWRSRLREGSPVTLEARFHAHVDREGSPASPLTSDEPQEASCLLLQEGTQISLPWERRTFPLLEAELVGLEEEEEEQEEDLCEVSGRSRSTDSGISLGSLELSPRTPQPAALPTAKLSMATSSTQDPLYLPVSTLSAALHHPSPLYPSNLPTQPEQRPAQTTSNTP